MPLTVVVALAAAFLLPLAQAWMTSTSRSDHAVHAHFVEAIRRRGHRLLTDFPGLLNPSPCGYPLFLHAVLSFVDRKWVARTGFLLNPVATLLQAGLLASWIAGEGRLEDAGWAALGFALTPHNHHPGNARVAGLSARPVGALLFLALALAGFRIDSGADALTGLLPGALAGYLLFGTSAFAQQGAVFLSLALGTGFGAWGMAKATLAGLAVFMAVHPHFSLAYLSGKLAHLRNYSRNLADRFILRVRPSVWGDFVGEFWRRLRRSPAKAVHYMHSNPVVVVLLLDPFVPLSASLLLLDPRNQVPSHEVFAAQVCAAALAVFLLTSLRPLRFLGEPERYVELAAPLGAAAAVPALARWSLWATAAWVAAFLILNAMELWLARRISRIGGPLDGMLDEVRRALAATGEPVRLLSNNLGWMKRLLDPDWSFVFYWPTLEHFGGVPLSEAFQEYPIVEPKALEALAITYRPTFCLLDPAFQSQPFLSGAPTGVTTEELRRSPEFILLRLAYAQEAR